MNYKTLICENVMPEVKDGSDDPFIIWRESNEWEFEFLLSNDDGKVAARIREKDPSAITAAGADFAKGSYPYVFDKILAMRFRAEYDEKILDMRYHANNDGTAYDEAYRKELAELVDFLEDNMGEFTSNTVEYLASLNNPLVKIHAQFASNFNTNDFAENISLIENMRDESAEERLNEFATELENISAKYGIVVKAIGGLCIYDTGDIVSVQYSRDHTSGDLYAEQIEYDPAVKDEYEMGGYN
jgi:hypothetical protein